MLFRFHQTTTGFLRRLNKQDRLRSKARRRVSRLGRIAPESLEERRLLAGDERGALLRLGQPASGLVDSDFTEAEAPSTDPAALVVTGQSVYSDSVANGWWVGSLGVSINLTHDE